MNDDVKKLFNAQSIVAFGTADKKGKPNVIAVYWKKIVDDKTILFIDNFMNKTIKNIKENNKVCVSFWDAKNDEGYQIKGTAKYHTDGKLFEENKKWIKSINPNRNPKGVIEIKIEEIYSLKPGTNAGERIE